MKKMWIFISVGLICVLMVMLFSHFFQEGEVVSSHQNMPGTLPASNHCESDLSSTTNTQIIHQPLLDKEFSPTSSSPAQVIPVPQTAPSEFIPPVRKPGMPWPPNMPDTDIPAPPV